MLLKKKRLTLRFTDEILLERIKLDDVNAFKELYENYWQSLLEIARSKLFNEEMAQDEVQNIFVSLWENRQNWEIKNFKAYAITSIKNKAINHYRQKLQSDKYIFEKSNTLNTYTNFIDNNLIFDELYAKLEKCINGFPEKTKQIFTLSRMNYMPISTIAKQVNLSEKAVEYHITICLKKLKVLFKDIMP